MTPPPRSTATAPGKVNLYFAVGPARADGYHEVASLYAAVDLHETVTAELGPRGSGTSITTSLRPGSALAAMAERGRFRLDAVPSDGRNLAVRAAALLLRRHGLPEDLGLRLEVVKEIPVAGGMAGGSADAAAALRAVGRLLARAGLAPRLGEAELRELAAELGADVPFALLGGVAVGRGTGTELTPVPLAEPLAVELLPAEYGLSTPEVFRELDRLRARGAAPAPESPEVPARLLRALAEPGLDVARLAPLLRNDLQAAAVSLRPELAAALGPREGRATMLSGSGPTVLRLDGPGGASSGPGEGQEPFAEAIRTVIPASPGPA
jgi:4-diphosphocytidyl-2-C-methyl-D-erythritol kinase